MNYTSKEAAELLRTRLKPYLQVKPPMAQSRFSVTLRNIENGFAKPKTADEFFSIFGFTGTFPNYTLDPATWVIKAR